MDYLLSSFFFYSERELEKDPLKSFKGSFNVRIAPELHSKAYKTASLSGKSLNQFVQEAIEKQVESLTFFS